MSAPDANAQEIVGVHTLSRASSALVDPLKYPHTLTSRTHLSLCQRLSLHPPHSLSTLAPSTAAALAQDGMQQLQASMGLIMLHFNIPPPSLPGRLADAGGSVQGSGKLPCEGGQGRGRRRNISSERQGQGEGGASEAYLDDASSAETPAMVVDTLVGREAALVAATATATAAAATAAVRTTERGDGSRGNAVGWGGVEGGGSGGRSTAAAAGAANAYASAHRSAFSPRTTFSSRDGSARLGEVSGKWWEGVLIWEGLGGHV